MKTKIAFLIFLAATLVGNIYAQNKNVLKVQMEKWDNHQSPSHVSHLIHKSQALNPGQELFRTEYDFMCLNSIDNLIDLFDLDGDGDLDPLMTGMQRFSTATQRTVRFAYITSGNPPAHFSAFDTTTMTSGSNTYGWGNIQVCVGGDWDGNALMFAHSNGNSYWSLIDLTSFTPVTPFSTVSIPGNFPSFVYLNDGTILMNNTNFVFYKSTDYGATFDSLFFIGDGDPNFTYNSSNTPAELPVMKSEDGMYISTVGGFDGVFNSGNPDGLYWYGSSDGGATWNGMAAAKGSGNNPEYGQVINRDYAPYFSIFAQVNYNVSNDGVTHLVCNGYGGGLLPGATDTTNVFPILYWNSNHQNWIAITDPSTEGPTDGFGHYVTGTGRLYAGNGIGQAYPNVATSADGQIVFVAWQGFEYTGEIGNSEWNIYPGDGSAQSSSIYFTDLYYVYSTDFGETWSDPNILKGDADLMEQYPYLARRIESQGNEVMRVHYIYQEDAIPGVAIFNFQWGQNSFSDETKWLYETYTFSISNVEDEINQVEKFVLEQNYPNPFNPSTKIKYSIPVVGTRDRVSVQLKVYDVLGNEIATLVNEEKQAGVYEVEFSAKGGSASGGNVSNLSSGVYFYTLSAGNYFVTKKMILLR